MNFAGFGPRAKRDPLTGQAASDAFSPVRTVYGCARSRSRAAQRFTCRCSGGRREGVVSPLTALRAMDVAAVKRDTRTYDPVDGTRKEIRHGEGEEPGP